MGNDGGSIPKRRELVKEAAKALTGAQLKEAQNEQQEYGWTTDPLTRKPLSPPVVSDAAGILYNKDSIIEFLLKNDDDREKEEMRKIGGVKGTVEGGSTELGCFGDRVKGLKDIVEIRFEVDQEGKWKCPITGRDLGPGAKACYIVPCGHAFAGNVIKEVKESNCLQCNEPYAETDMISILPTLPNDIAHLNSRLKDLREKGLTHALKKAQGSKKRRKGPSGETIGEINGAKGIKEAGEAKKKEVREGVPVMNSTIKNASTASLTKKVLEEQEARNKKRKLMENNNIKSLFSQAQDKPDLKRSADYMTRGYSIGKK